MNIDAYLEHCAERIPFTSDDVLEARHILHDLLDTGLIALREGREREASEAVAMALARVRGTQDTIPRRILRLIHRMHTDERDLLVEACGQLPKATQKQILRLIRDCTRRRVP